MINIRFIVVNVAKLKMWCLVGFIGWLAFACEEFCEDLDRTAIVINFYQIGDNTPTADDKPTAINVRIVNVENDSVLYPNPRLFTQASNSQVLLPVNPHLDSMVFSIQNGELPPDTLIFKYTRHVGFISAQCGCATFAKIHEVTLLERKKEEKEEEEEIIEHSIVHLEIINPSAGTVSYRQGVINEENIRIYY